MGDEAQGVGEDVDVVWCEEVFGEVGHAVDGGAQEDDGVGEAGVEGWRGCAGSEGRGTWRWWSCEHGDLRFGWR